MLLTRTEGALCTAALFDQEIISMDVKSLLRDPN